MSIWPMDNIDLVSYLVLETNFITVQQIQSSKTSQGQQPVCEWKGEGCMFVENIRKTCDDWTSECSSI